MMIGEAGGRAMRSCRAFAFTLSVLCGVLSGAANCAPEEMTSLKKYMEQDFKRNPRPQFVFLRCAAIYTIVVQIQTKLGREKEAEAYLELANKFLKGTSKDRYAVDQLNGMIAAYNQHFIRTKAATTKFTVDPLFSSDLEFCSELEKTIQKMNGGRPAQ